jgi:hypothetical protein
MTAAGGVDGTEDFLEEQAEKAASATSARVAVFLFMTSLP